MKAVIVASVLVLTACSSGAGTTVQPASSLPAATTPGTSAATTPGATAPTTPGSAAPSTTAPAASTPTVPPATPSRTATPAARRTGTASATPSPTRAPRTYAIDMLTRNRFSPDALTLRAGDAVLVTNRDLLAHDFTIEELGVESGEMNQGDTFRRAFAAPGTYTFVCTRHPNMDGTLTVAR